jgi:preprotein translocase subunit SecE
MKCGRRAGASATAVSPATAGQRNEAVKTSTMDTVKGPPKSQSPARTAAGDDEGGVLGRPAAWWDRARTFLTEVRAEMKRVTWPGRREVYATTVVVILVSVFFGLYLWGVDLIISSAVHWLLRQVGA